MNWVYDIEVFTNLFMLSAKNTETGEERSFIIGETQNDLRSLLIFLSSEVESMIGFNNIGYDYPVIHPLMDNWKHFWDRYQNDPLGLCKFFYNRSADIINCPREDFFSKYWYFDPVRPQIDLYRIYHLNNKNKRGTSLKWIEFSINHELLQTFDFDPHEKISALDVQNVLLYNLNDVRATFNFYEHSKSKIEYRQELGKIEELDLINQSDTGIAKKIFQKYLTAHMGIKNSELKALKTYRSKVAFKDIIFDYIEFETPHFQEFLKYLKGYTYIPGDENTKFSPTIEHCNLHFDYGVGGLHAYPKRWVIGRNGTRKKDPESIPQRDYSDDKYQIIHVDVKSYYPNIAIANKIKPEHLGENFDTIYKHLYEQRLEAQRKGDSLMNSAMKLTLNSAFGLSNERNSFFYDPKFLWTITINGQLMLTMLAEKFYMSKIKMLQCNTDGIYVYIEKSQISLLESLCNDWCSLTGLTLEYEYYDNLFQKDVNNYIGKKANGYVTKKGSFRDVKQVHEDSSATIVALALERHLIYGEDYREFIHRYEDLTPFLMALKIKGREDEVQERFLDESKTQLQTIVHKKAVRYIVSKKGFPFYKYFDESGKDQKIHAGFKCLCANDLSTVSRSDVDEAFYIAEVEKITSLFQTNQYSLF